MWVARDSNGALFLYEDKPYKKEYEGYWKGEKIVGILTENDFPGVKWEDEEPTELIVSVKSKSNDRLE